MFGKKLFKNVGKEPCKFQFNLSLDNVDGFKAPEHKSASKIPVTYTYNVCVTNFLHTDLYFFYDQITWKRGSKRKGETTFVQETGGRLVFNQTFKFNGTMFKEKKNAKNPWGKKLLSITLEEVRFIKYFISFSM
jgi:hypothetical protein